MLDEVLYRKGMSNKQLADRLNNEEHALVVADSAEPKSIDELKKYGISIVPADKGPGSITKGIQYVQDKRISVTKTSLNILKEYRNYLWRIDRDGKTINKPEDGFDHTMDAIRYGINSMLPQNRRPKRQSNRPKLTYGGPM